MKIFCFQFKDVSWYVDQMKPRGLAGRMSAQTVEDFLKGSLEKYVRPTNGDIATIMSSMRSCGHITDLITLTNSMISGPDSRRCTFFIKKRSIIPSALSLSEGSIVINQSGMIARGDYSYAVKMKLTVDCRELTEEEAQLLGDDDPSLLIGCMDNIAAEDFIKGDDLGSPVGSPKGTQSSSLARSPKQGGT
ncbi:TPA_asm: M [Triticum alphacytorhabdovirus 1]|nr:TPA_asm: M [Triticum alphacytorhabdovirus 1]